jgi:hypothetical protein
MHKNHERTRAVTVHRGVSERPVHVRQTRSAAAAGRSNLRMVPLDTLHDQVRNLRMEISDLKIQVSDLAATFGRA